MIWQIVLLIIIILLIIPIPINFNLKFNVLRLSGDVQIQVFKFINYSSHVRFRGQYIYITQNNKTRREKITSKNFNLAFVVQLSKQLYFRLILQYLSFVSIGGYYNDAMVTALGASLIDVVSKCIYAKILHNKKSAHIFIQNEQKYNQDCLHFKVECKLNISIFDILYSVVNSLWSLKGEKYEAGNSQTQQD